MAALTQQGTKWYYLDGNKICATDSFEEYVALMGKPDRLSTQVSETFVGEMRISTIFLSGFYFISDNANEQKPMLFETMVFEGPLDGMQLRAINFEYAEKNHTLAVNEALSIQSELERLYRILESFDPAL